MFGETPELSPDLEWMILSGQAGDRSLVSALVNEHYHSAYRLALSLVDDAALAGAATDEAFSRAVLDTHRFTGDSSIRIWLYAIVLDTCQRMAERRGVDGNSRSGDLFEVALPSPRQPVEASLWRALDFLPIAQKTPYILHVVHGMSSMEIAHLVRTTEETVDKRIVEAQEAINRVFVEHGASAAAGPLESSASAIANSLERRWRRPDFSSESLQLGKERILALVRKARDSQRLQVRLKEIALVCLAILVVTLALAAANRWLADDRIPTPAPAMQQPTRRTSGDGQIVRGTPVTALPPFPQVITSPRQTNQIFLTYQSSPEEVARLIEHGHQTWNTLWAEVQIYFYGPPGYVGPPEVHRHQVWIRRGEGGLWVSGLLGGRPENVSLLGVGWSGSPSPVHSLWALERLGSQVPWIELSAVRLRNSPVLYRSYRISSPRALRQAGFTITGNEQVAGRQAVIVDQYSPNGDRLAELAVDSSTGIILRERHFGGQDGKIVLMDAVVTAISYDVDFSDEFLQEEHIAAMRERFAFDHPGRTPPFPARRSSINLVQDAQREHIQPSTPPPGFDPSTSELTFQFGGRTSPSVVAEIFAEEVLLGTVWMGDPFTLLCQRSPDGWTIAYASKDHRAHPANHLHIGRLPDLEIVHAPGGAFDVDRLLFSPDGSMLAVSASWIEGGDDLRERSGILVFDVETGEMLKAYPIRGVQLLGWHPEGEYLAVLRWFKRLKERFEVQGVRVADGEIISGEGSFLVTQRVSFSIPQLGWEDEFDLAPAGLEACAAPTPLDPS